jgi:hypothetical protein
MAGILPKPASSGRCHGITAREQGAIAEDEDSDASSNFSPHWSSSDSDAASEEGEEEIVEGRRDMERFLANWITVYGEAASNMTLFERSVLMPDIKGIEVLGSRGAKKIIVAGDVDKTILPLVVQCILLLIQDGRRCRTTFNTAAAFRMREEVEDPAIEKAVIIIVSPSKITQDNEGRWLLPDEQDKGWRKVRKERFDPSDLFSSTDTFSGSRRKEDSVCGSINHRTDQAYPCKRTSPTFPQAESTQGSPIKTGYSKKETTND